MFLVPVRTACINLHVDVNNEVISLAFVIECLLRLDCLNLSDAEFICHRTQLAMVCSVTTTLMFLFLLSRRPSGMMHHHIPFANCTLEEVMKKKGELINLTS